MFALTAPHSFAQDIKRSRFLAVAAPVADEKAAKDFIAAQSSSEATHNCWAWRIGQNYRFSDDGEPSGTAGKPILQAIDGQALDNVAVVVTRWFGGVLLGSGGLIRAYGGTAALCLQAAGKKPVIPMVRAAITLIFSDLALVKARILSLPDVSLAAEHFTETGAVLDVNLPETDAGTILQMAVDLTSGRVQIGTEP